MTILYIECITRNAKLVCLMLVKCLNVRDAIAVALELNTRGIIRHISVELSFLQNCKNKPI